MVKHFPRLPRGFEAPAGPVTVHVMEGSTLNGGAQAFGSWEHANRRIEIGKDVNPRKQWWTFFHEATHCALDDSGVDEMLTPKQQEAICDAVATARLRERFG